MDFTRAQVAAALTALGLDPHTTSSVVIGPTTVYAEIATLEDGHPLIEHGALITDAVNATITEEASNVSS